MNLNEPLRHCLGCGAEIKVRAALGHCPRCLVTLGTSVAAADKPVFKVRRFGDYELLEQVGRGGMGVVYRARQISLNRMVALKMVLDSQLSSPLALRRFEIEAEAAARLDHPHIVSIFEIGSDEEQPFISMSFIDGESLAQKIARGEFGRPAEIGMKGQRRQVQESVAQLMATVAHAVHSAHQRGVIHRDLKPGNILVDADGQPHLTDFGLAKLADSADSLSQTGALAGTLSYMAPEQAAGVGATVASDIYSLGAVLYELLTGRTPFNAATPVEMLRMVAERPPPRPSGFDKDIDRDLETICLKCMEKHPSSRYGSALSLAEDLERWQRGETILARPVGPLLRLGRWGRRNPVGAALILSLLVGLTVTVSLLRIVAEQYGDLFALGAAADEARRKAERNMEMAWKVMGVSNFWDNPGVPIPIYSETLADIAGTAFNRGGAEKVERYSIGMLLEEHPVDVIVGYAPLIGQLERAVTNSLGRPVWFDLQLYHEKHEAGIEALKTHQVNILKIGGSSFLKANKDDPGIQPLVGQNPVKSGVLFARKDSGIKTVRDLMEKSIAMKREYSTIRLGAAFLLAEAGVSFANFVEPPRPKSNWNAAQLRQLPKGKRAPKVTDFSPEIEAVLTGKADSGVVSESVFQRHEKSAAELVVLKTFPSPSRVYWLADSGLPKDVGRHIKDAMVALRDPALFDGLADNVTSYSEVTEQEVQALRNAAAVVEAAAGKAD